MYLMDAISETAVRLRGVRAGPFLTIYRSLQERLVGCPRFLFDNNAIHTAVELTLGRPKVLLEALQHLRIPYPKLWCEWEESGREGLRRRFAGEIGPHRPLPDRVGFLLECNASGRKGQITWVWSAMRENVPNVGPFAAFFDFDRTFPMSEEAILSLLSGNLAKLWEDSPVQQEAMLAIWRTVNHRPDGVWAEDFLDHLLASQGEKAIAYAMSDVVGEYIQALANLLLLTSSRQIVEMSDVSMARLNKARAKRRELPRLDHTVVALHLDPAGVRRQRRAPLGYARKSPRVHLVSSYLNRRGDKHWIVSPFMRGSGETISRHVRVQK